MILYYTTNNVHKSIKKEKEICILEALFYFGILLIFYN